MSSRFWYHGTKEDAKTFKLHPPSVSNLFYVAKNIEYAKHYGSNIYKLTLNENIKIFDPSDINQVKELKWPKFFNYCLEKSKKKKFDLFVFFRYIAPYQNLYGYIERSNGKIDQNDIDEWKEFCLFRGYHHYQGDFKSTDPKNDANQLRTILMRDLSKLDYKAYKSFEHQVDADSEILGIFSLDAIDKIAKNPM